MVATPRDLMKGNDALSTIALLGATGRIGSRILGEALGRRHKVTAITRDPGKLGPRDGMTVRAGNTMDGAALASILAGHDVVAVSVKWNENDIRRVTDTIRQSGVSRALFVIGAGSLLRSDGRRVYDHTIETRTPPPTSLPAIQAYEFIRTIGDLDWTAISPSASIVPGEGTGKFRLGLDRLIEDDKGESRISCEDFAIAIVDEIERPQHIRMRFTAGY